MRQSRNTLALAGLLAALCQAALAGQVVVPLPAASYEAAPAANPFDPGAECVRVVAPGFGSTGSPGEPDLPCRQIHVALPRDADLASIRVSVANGQYAETQLDRDIVPCGPMHPTDGSGADIWGPGKEITRGRNMLVYGSDAPYPASHVELAHAGQMRLWKLATVLYRPLTYNPVTRVLTSLTAGDLVVAYDAESSVKAAAVVRDAAAGRFQPALQSLVSNYADAAKWYVADAEPKQAPAEPSGAADFVIITRSYIVSNSTKFAQFVTRTQERGHTVQVLTESQWGGGTGLAATNNIRQWLKNNYLSLGITYVLLIGNPTPDCYISSQVCAPCCQNAPAAGDVPMLAVWPHWNEYSDPSLHGGSAPTDMYFSDLTGNWDLDGDGVYGDYKKGANLHDFGAGGVDFYPEVYAGRIPFYGEPGNPQQFAAAIADLDKILSKYIYHSPPWTGDWSRRALLPANPLDPNHPEVSLAEALKKDVLTPAGLNCTRIYDVDGGTAPEVMPCTYDTVKTAWQQGAAFVFWTAHGNATGAVDVLTSDRCWYLDDTRPSFVFQNSCSTGRPEASDNLGYSLLKNGAIATVAAARVSWYGTLDYLNGTDDEAILYRYAMRLARWGRRCGEALAFTKADVLPYDEYGWDNYAMYNLYGEPSLAGIVTIDECSGAEQITSLPYNTVVNDVGLATTAVTDPDLTCGSGANRKGSHSVWFRFTASEAAIYEANTIGSGYDTVLAVFSGSCGALLELACSDDYDQRQSLVTWVGQQGVTYYIEATSYGNSAANTLYLEVRRWNDECTSAEVITSVPYKATEYTGAAGTSAGDPFLSCGSVTNRQGSHTVWHKFTAPYNAPFEANTTGSNYDTVLAVFTGYCGTYTEVACNDDYAGTNGSKVFWQAQAGVDYYIEVTSYGTMAGGILRLEVKCSPPVNDESSNPWTIYAMPYNAQQDTRCATTAPLDPWLTCSGRGSHSVWYKLTPSTMAPHEASTTGSDYDTVLAVFSSVGGQLTQVACSDNYGGTQQSRLTWQPQSGVDFYLIEIASFGFTDGGIMNLAIKAAVPDNDDCLQAIAVGPLPYTASQDTTYATTAEFDPSLSCGDPALPKGGHSVWYTFAPSQSGEYEANTVGSDYDTVLAVLTGYCSATHEVACDDDSVRPQSKLTWQAQAGTTYFIEIASFGNNSGGNLQLYVNRVVPANDNCAGARILTAPSDLVSQSTQSATFEPNEPTPTCHISYNTVWFKFTPASTGNALLSTYGSDFDTVLAVYTGECGGPYTQVACNDDAIGAAPGSRWSAVAVNVQAGVAYLVQVGSYNLDATGNLSLRFDLGPACRPISQIKCWPIGTRVAICNVVVGGYFLGFPKVQQLDRASAIHLSLSSATLSSGTRVTAIGSLARSAQGNLYLQYGSYVGTRAGTVKPLGMTTKAVGGSDFCSQLGAPGGSGPNNVSLLVKVWGRVTGVDAVNKWYWVDDGCGLTGDPPYTGLRIWTERTTLPSVNDYVYVVGMPWIFEPYGAPLICEPAPPIAALQSVDKSVLILPPPPDGDKKDPAVGR